MTRERRITKVEKIPEGEDAGRCMRSPQAKLHGGCEESATHVIYIEYADEPGITFWTDMCREHTIEATKENDRKIIFGDSAKNQNI